MSKAYTRYSADKITGKDCTAALKSYVAHYAQIAEENPDLLNQKVPRSVFRDVLNEVGNLLQKHAERLSREDLAIKEFLKKNSLPSCLGTALTEEVRTFALLLNAVAQWTTAQQLAMDSFLFSNKARKELKEIGKEIPIFTPDSPDEPMELHHPVRDGRPPIPLRKKRHEAVEGILHIDEGDEGGKRLLEFKKLTGTSWIRLRIGCMIELGDEPQEAIPSPSYRKDCISRTKKAKASTGLTAQKILEILDRYELGHITV